jgi:hypothetical protein
MINDFLLQYNESTRKSTKKKQLNFNKDLNKKYNLRNKNNLSQPKIAGNLASGSCDSPIKI